MIFGEKIKELREARGWSQPALARLAGISQATLSTIESGNQRSTRSLPKIAAALGVSMADLDPELRDFRFRPSMEMLESSTLAFEAMLQALREDLGPEARKDLTLIFLDLVREPPVGDTAESRAEDMRRRLVRMLIKMKI